jgi:hypothetical protein
MKGHHKINTAKTIRLCTTFKSLVLSLVTVILLPLTGTCHPKEVLHFGDQAAVFGFSTRGVPEFRTVCKAVNGCDSALKNMFEKSFGVRLTPNDHRYIGHNLLAGAIPGTSIGYLYAKARSAGFDGSRKDFAARLGRLNAKFKEGVVKVAMQKLALNRKEAMALVCILHDIHLLGDLTPDNSRIQTIPKYAEIVHDIKTKLVNLMDNDVSRELITESLERLLGESVEIAGRDGTQHAAEHLLHGMCEARMLSGALAYRW